MARARARDLTVGVVAALALAILALAIMAVGEESRLFADKASYQVAFPNTVGLVVGSPVLIAGVQVGTVSDIRLPTDPNEPGIRVKLGIERKYAERVREDSLVALRILQLLSGEKYVEVTPGSPGRPPLLENAEIPLLQETALLEQGEDIAQNLNEITLSLREILGPLQRGEGVLGEMIQNPDFGREGLESLGETMKNLEALTRQITRGQGFVGRAVYDDAFAARVDDLSSGIENLSELTECLSRDEGSLCELLARDGSFQQAVESFRDGAASLNRTVARLESGEGLLGKLLSDDEYSERLVEDLDASMHHLAEIARKIDEGEGTLGAMLNERVLYDGAEDVVAGVNDSKFARWLIRHYRKKGIKARERDAGRESSREGE